MSLHKIALAAAIFLLSSFASAYNESACKKVVNDYELLLESNELIKISRNIVDIARRLDELKINSNTDFFIAGVWANHVGTSGFQLSYALWLMKQVDKAKLNAINNDEKFQIHITSYSKIFDHVLDIVSNYYVIEKNSAARDEIGKLKRQLEFMSNKYSGCK